jgi:hypothetical protein
VAQAGAERTVAARAGAKRKATQGARRGRKKAAGRDQKEIT